MIDIIRELIKDKSVLILGYGREGRSSWQRIKEAGGYRQIAIADMNQVQTEEGHPARLIIRNAWMILMLSSKVPGSYLKKIFMIIAVKLFHRQNYFSDVSAVSVSASPEQRARVQRQR